MCNSIRPFSLFQKRFNKHLYRLFWLVVPSIIAGCWIIPEAHAQGNRIIPLESWNYEYISRLQRRGYLLDLHPTALPYTVEAVISALDKLDEDRLSSTERQWINLLYSDLSLPKLKKDQTLFGAAIQAGASFTDNDRLTPLRPIDAGRATIKLGDVRVFPNAGLSLYIEKNDWIAHLGAHHDVFYDNDPDGLDAARRLYTRSENAYIGYDGSFVSIYLGRFSNNWGLYGNPGTVISNNPRSYDQINFRLGNDRISLRSIVGELDSVTEDDEFTGTAFRAGSKRRYLAAHRLDWRPSRFLNLTFVESVLYSGQNAGMTLKYLNPLHTLAFVVDNIPKNVENNGLLAGMLWGQVGRLTIHGQLLVDDLDVLNRLEPSSVALTGTLLYAELIKNADAGASFELVTARAYNTHQTEGQYTYLQRGLATQFSDYITISAFSDIYLDDVARGLMLTPRVDILWQGERDIRQPYPLNRENVALILHGSVEQTIRTAIRARYQPGRFWWIAADIGPNFTSVDAARSTEFVGLLEFGVRISLVQPFGLLR